MKPDAAVRTVHVVCPCGFAGDIEVDECLSPISKCPRCNDYWKIQVKVTVINIKPFDEWVERIRNTVRHEHSIDITDASIRGKLNQVVEVEELMFKEVSDKWDLSKWRGCVDATMYWIEQKIKDGKIKELER